MSNVVNIKDHREKAKLPFWCSPMSQRIELRQEFDDDLNPTGKRIPIKVLSQVIAPNRKERHTKGVRLDIDMLDLIGLDRAEVERLVAYKTRLCLEQLGIIHERESD